MKKALIGLLILVSNATFATSFKSPLIFKIYQELKVFNAGLSSSDKFKGITCSSAKRVLPSGANDIRQCFADKYDFFHPKYEEGEIIGDTKHFYGNIRFPKEARKQLMASALPSSIKEIVLSNSRDLQYAYFQIFLSTEWVEFEDDYLTMKGIIIWDQEYNEGITLTDDWVGEENPRVEI